MTGAYVALTRLCIFAFDLSPVLPDFLSPREATVGGVFLVGALAQLGFVTVAILVGVPEFRRSLAAGFRPATRQAWVVALAAAAIQCAAIALFFLPEPLRMFELSERKALLSLLPVSDGWTQEVVFRGYVMLRLAKAGLPAWLQVAASGAAFASIHVGYIGSDNLGLLWPLVGTATLGGFLAWSVVVGKGSLRPAITAHAAIIVAVQPWLALAA